MLGRCSRRHHCYYRPHLRHHHLLRYLARQASQKHKSRLEKQALLTREYSDRAGVSRTGGGSRMPQLPVRGGFNMDIFLNYSRRKQDGSSYKNGTKKCGIPGLSCSEGLVSRWGRHYQLQHGDAVSLSNWFSPSHYNLRGFISRLSRILYGRPASMMTGGSPHAEASCARPGSPFELGI